jgi:hypothetical protein
MTFLETLKANHGALIRLTTQLFWYKEGGWDNKSGRICLILDAIGHGIHLSVDADAHTGHPGQNDGFYEAAAFLIIDGLPKWVWIDKRHFEIITSEAT